MNADLVTDFRDLLAVESIKINDSVSNDINKAVSDAAARGMLQSSAAMQMTAGCAAAAIPIFANAAFNIMLRAAAAHGVEVSSANRADVHAQLKSVIDEEVEELKKRVGRTPPFKADLGAKFADQVLSGLTEKASLEISRLEGELRLIAAAQSRKPTDDGKQTIIINAPVGVVQTGPGSYGSATQHIDQGTSEALHKALSLVIEKLSEHSAQSAINVSEVRDLAVEGKAELAKEKPNATKVKSIIKGIGDTIAYLPNFKEAYETLKWAGLAIGVALS